MIFFIILGTLIMVSEISLSLPINISIFSLIFTNITNRIIIHILVILFASLIFIYVTYSFSKINNWEENIYYLEEIRQIHLDFCLIAIS